MIHPRMLIMYKKLKKIIAKKNYAISDYIYNFQFNNVNENKTHML